MGILVGVSVCWSAVLSFDGNAWLSILIGQGVRWLQTQCVAAELSLLPVSNELHIVMRPLEKASKLATPRANSTLEAFT